MKRDRGMGRRAINWLKVEYDEGAEFSGAVEVRAALIGAFGLKPSRVSLGTARDWDLQARIERAGEGSFTTQPVYQTSFLRSAVAEPEVRTMTQGARIAELATRTERQALFADARAAQPNATAVDIERAVRLRIARSILREIVT